ncbi:MAG TPA: helix-turn-helix transcriptional regulator, partial [Thermomicrobiales bacterium]|nr:helix-turn-helix transcriptional regulator [Thermomicrobiales bacterium]
MTNHKTRSPFGELVYALRKKRGWTQARLAREAPPLRPVPDARMRTTERTIRAIEHRATNPRGWTKPRQDTVAALAAAFHLDEGSLARVTFLQAAASTRQAIDRPGAVDPTGIPRQRFVLAGREPHLAHISTAI